MPLEYNVLSLAEARLMVDTVLDHVQKNGLPPTAVVVCDKFGEVIASARMDGCSPLYIKSAERKAYSSAIFERDTDGLIDFWAGQKKNGHKGPMDWNDTKLTTLPGGFVVCNGRRGGPYGGFDVVGGIGVSTEEEADEEAIAEVAIQALGGEFRHRRDWN
jgi:uncharacterized protein GlcG (DUF336 family)